MKCKHGNPWMLCITCDHELLGDQFMQTVKKGMMIGVDPGDGHIMVRRISEIQITPDSVKLILKETEKSERRWAKNKRPEGAK